MKLSLLKNNSTSYLSTGDTVISKQSDHVARLAVGAGIKGVDMIMSEEITSAFALVRPPGIMQQLQEEWVSVYSIM